jgi:hypothetical protein
MDRLKNKTSDATGEQLSYAGARHLENCMSLPIESSVRGNQENNVHGQTNSIHNNLS